MEVWMLVLGGTMLVAALVAVGVWTAAILGPLDRADALLKELERPALPRGPVGKGVFRPGQAPYLPQQSRPYEGWAEDTPRTRLRTVPGGLYLYARASTAWQPYPSDLYLLEHGVTRPSEQQKQTMHARWLNGTLYYYPVAPWR